MFDNWYNSIWEDGSYWGSKDPSAAENLAGANILFNMIKQGELQAGLDGISGSYTKDALYETIDGVDVAQLIGYG